MAPILFGLSEGCVKLWQSVQECDGFSMVWRRVGNWLGLSEIYLKSWQMAVFAEM